jgi:hypothetical protein
LGRRIYDTFAAVVYHRACQPAGSRQPRPADCGRATPAPQAAPLLAEYLSSQGLVAVLEVLQGAAHLWGQPQGAEQQDEAAAAEEEAVPDGRTPPLEAEEAAGAAGGAASGAAAGLLAEAELEPGAVVPVLQAGPQLLPLAAGAQQWASEGLASVAASLLPAAPSLEDTAGLGATEVAAAAAQGALLPPPPAAGAGSGAHDAAGAAASAAADELEAAAESVGQWFLGGLAARRGRPLQAAKAAGSSPPASLGAAAPSQRPAKPSSSAPLQPVEGEGEEAPPAPACPGGGASSASTSSSGYSYDLWRGFAAPGLEQRYLRHKHAQYLVLDYFSILFLAAYTFAMAKRMRWEAQASSNLPVLAFLLVKLVPYLVLLCAPAAFLARREAILAAAELSKNLLVVLGSKGVVRMPMPTAALTTIYRSHADLVIFGLIRPLLQPVRWRLHLLLVTLEAATMPWLFAQVVPSWLQVLRRFALSLALSLAVGALNDVYARRQFVRHCCRVRREEKQQNVGASGKGE